MKTAHLPLPADYQLEQSIRFLTGFTPQPAAPGEGVELRFATPLSPSWTPTEIVITQPDDCLRIAWSTSVDAETVTSHVSRILSIDMDGTGFFDVIANDPVLAEAVDPALGIRPPLFWSPYEAAVWTVLCQRVSMRQATTLKTRLARELGTHHGELDATPQPEKLAAIDKVSGVNQTRIDRLKAVADAAIDGVLDPVRLRSLSTGDALVQLQAINGVGPFSADLILARGAGAPDVFPTTEKRLHQSMRSRYQRSEATVTELADIAQSWAPFRSWASFQLRAAAERGDVA